MNSGTSADGLNAVLAEFRLGSPPRALKSALFPFHPGISKSIIEAGDSENYGVKELLELHARLGESMGRSARRFHVMCQKAGLKVDMIASHGQTIKHIPEKSISLQIGDPSIIAAISGLPVVADFRSSDLAAGGQGAPLSPILHQYLFQDLRLWRGVINIGGIANITILPPPNSRRLPFAADCGPGNMIIDSLMRQLYGRQYDDKGLIALSGVADQRVVSTIMRNRFFRLPPPKSTGRELFGRSFSTRILNTMKKSSKADIIATATEITVNAAADFVKRFAPGINELYLCGGGSKNRYLTASLARALPAIDLLPVSCLGFESDVIEPLLWAYLAWRFIRGETVATGRFTGARKPHLPGALWLP